MGISLIFYNSYFVNNFVISRSHFIEQIFDYPSVNFFTIYFHTLPL
nr:MAG TPA: hypothetical protein [Caudoviricetes sp.]